MSNKDFQHIEIVLDQLANLYNNQGIDKESLHIPKELLCKMASLELCSWLEDIFDGWINNYLNKITNTLSNQESHFSEYTGDFNKWEKTVKDKIKNTHGLSYTKHFRPLLTALLGNLTVLQLEKEIGLAEIEGFSNILNSLHDSRNELAHKSYFNIIQQHKIIDDPSSVLKKFQDIKPTLKKFESYLINMSIQFT